MSKFQFISDKLKTANNPWNNDNTSEKDLCFYKYSSFKRCHDQNVDRNGNWSFGIDANYISQESNDMFSISIRKNSFIAVINSKNARKKNYDSIG